MDPEALNRWIPVLRDLAIVLVAIFMLLFGTIWVHEPSILTILIGGGLALLGAPAAIRADTRRKNGKPTGEMDKEDRWSHMP